jgi:hypothetical protein
MSNSINNLTQTNPAASGEASAGAVPNSANATQKSTQTNPQPKSTATAIPKDTVQISTAAQTALQESQETQVQTAKEAGNGDRQAQKLLAKETAIETGGR